MWDTLASITNVDQVNTNRDERFVSLISGGLLLLYALIRIPITAVFALLAALYLFFRGMRGFCYIYDQLERNTAVSSPQVEQREPREREKEKVTSSPVFITEPN